MPYSRTHWERTVARADGVRGMRAAAAVLLAGISAPALAQQAATADATASPVVVHLTGYADVTAVATAGEDARLEGTLAPILHVQIGSRLLLETELEATGDSEGAQETAVEYATASWLLGDHAALVVGKFLSPAGYFVQNLHASWINRLPAAPVGFGHGGAAPQSDVGVQLRGGVTLADGHELNYAVYRANGPQLVSEGMEGVDLDLEGATANRDDVRVTGGRVGWLPRPTVEFGVSAIRGGVRLADPMEIAPEPSRAYRVVGVDAAWRPLPKLDLRAEWLRQSVGSAATSSAPDALRWRAWYAQAGYAVADRWQAVLRVGDSRSPHAESTVRQVAVGMNFLIRPHRQLKLAREFNRADDPGAGADRWLLQLAYGF